MFCPACGTRATSDDITCRLCGALQPGHTAAEARQQAPAVALVPEPVRYGGFWRRLAALLLDAIVLYFPLVTVPLSLPPLAWGAVWPTALDWVALLVIAGSTQIAQVYLTRGLTLEKAGSATAIGYLQVVFAVLWGALAFNEVPDWRTLMGAALVVVGTVLVAATSRPPAL